MVTAAAPVAITPMKPVIQAAVHAVTERIRERSRPLRDAYLADRKSVV